MIVYPNAKINLGLNIVSKRADGFHNIETVFYPISIQDILEIIPNESEKVVFSSSGIKIPSDGSPNLVEKAWTLLHNEFGIKGVDVLLHKQIPIGAGLGGGSADAAFMITALNELFELNIPAKKLETIAGKLGADCAFFVKNKPVFAEEKGDVFSDIEIDLKGKFLALIYPNIHVSTPEAYRHVIAKDTEYDIEDILNTPISDWKEKLNNDFEDSVFKTYPQIKNQKELLYQQGAIYAAMSGSGSSIFGIFENKPELNIPKDHPHWIVEL